MKILPVISPKGGEGKSTFAAYLAGFLADAGLNTLLVDADYSQPTASSIFALEHESPFGLYELLMQMVSDHTQCISQTTIKNLDVIYSNDPDELLPTAMLHAADGRLRLRNILQHPFFNRYAEKIIQEQLPALQTQIENNQQVLGEDDVPRNMQGQPDALRIWAIEVALSSEEGKKLYDPILDGLRSAVRYDRTYFDKIVASLLPLLEKLTTGKTAELLSPDYQDIDDTRPIFDWEQIIRKKAVVYVGLDALSDSEVASAVGNSMFADLVSVAGHIYKHGINAGLPGGKEGKSLINLHCDEFNELMGDEFIPLINKGGGAGMQVTAYTQTSSDIEARIGNAAKTAQVQGNFNNLIMLRVRENRTAELLTTQLPQVEIYTKTLVSGHQDTADVNADQDFTSSTQDRVGTVKVPLLEPADIVTLPKGQAFALLEGGQLWKIRMPLPAGDADDVLMPESIEKIAEEMRRSYHSGESWWRDGPALNVPVTGGAND
ncbi:TPA: conjugative transfer system coupling protein TraD [Klebsiella pneumoniae]|uniref:Conjugative transfer system coupling protein TraD n=1 Tax=Citrobacter sedlakii TaxID=67826 RepID=A0ABS0ZWC3_9ENTR|nr:MULTISPECIES: conjugative transfer system coupling protein TraD [Klebsiella]ELS0729050.1 conjugative transfer system coupling protein TraD [Klebsiella michiganensis]MBJ8383095.1 conjugative transfer system coupling protein TraD [Citrobacter sedlakii]HBM3079586.1 conjugative transfer system coupling protein TraD [Klebsiella oxytoca]EIX9107004.1 conjugative transfer system coupling protein TraD [Klebsiella pneumoniae]EIX9149545.1 conjugative transfer system coupling protein TraD [Klebsiella p